jgi:hypothetical protein
MTATARALPAYGDITPAQQLRMDVDEAVTRERREAAGYKSLPRGAERENLDAVNCARCGHIGDFHAEGQRGFCMWLRHMVSTWHPVRCGAYRAA